MPNSSYRETPDAEQPIDPVRAAMTSTFNNIAGARTGVQGDLAAARIGVQNDLRGVMTQSAAMGMPPTAASTDSVALAMGLAAANRETPKEQARRILGGEPAAPEGGGGIDVLNAMGVSSLRTNYAAQRQARLGVMPYIPNADTTPEVAANNLNYLDMLTLRGAGNPLGAADAPGGTNTPGGMRTQLSGPFAAEPVTLNLDGQQGSFVDRRRAAVQAMSDAGTAQLAITPAERNRRAIIAAMTPASAPGASGSPGAGAPGAKPSIDDIMLGYSKAGGTGLSSGEVTKTLDSEAREKAEAAKPVKPAKLSDAEEVMGLSTAYKDALKNKDYISAMFLAKKLGHQIPSADKLGRPIPFSPAALPGYVADSTGGAQPAAGTDLATNKGAEQGAFRGQTATYKTPADVTAAFVAGTIDRATAKLILQKQFAHQ